jgi:signal-transduction protein with cAMP-binding, CBS, and nucleotidyltransferase domain
MKEDLKLEEVLKHLDSVRKLTPECLDYLRQGVKKQEVRKDEVLLKVGDINTRLYFVYTGFLHCFYFVGEKEVSDGFSFEKDLVVSIGSFYDQVPGEDCLVAMEDSLLYSITRDQYEFLCEEHHCFSNLARILLQTYLVTYHAHPRFIRKHSAAECIDMARAKFGHLFYRIPRAPIASWLGMEPETFSRNQ